jgi:large subunit ribosomal protein L54
MHIKMDWGRLANSLRIAVRFSSSSGNWVVSKIVFLMCSSSSLTLSGYRAARPTSILPEGTLIKGLNYLKGGSDPVALKDEEYPEWLWSCAEAPKKEYVGSEKRSRAYLKFKRSEAIKLSNFMKSR